MNSLVILEHLGDSIKYQEPLTYGYGTSMGQKVGYRPLSAVPECDFDDLNDRGFTGSWTLSIYLGFYRS